MKLPREIAGFDSASALVVALARFLHGQDTPPLGNPAFRALRPVAAMAARLPERTRQSIYSVFSGAEGRPAAEIGFQRALRAIPQRYPLPQPLSLAAVTELLRDRAAHHPGIRARLDRQRRSAP